MLRSKKLAGAATLFNYTIEFRTHKMFCILTFTNGTFFKLLKEEMMQVNNLCLDWYFPAPTKETNKFLLFQQMLSYSVCTFLLAVIYVRILF